MAQDDISELTPAKLPSQPHLHLLAVQGGSQGAMRLLSSISGQPKKRRTTLSFLPAGSQPPLSESLCQVRPSRCRETVPASGQARWDTECPAASGKGINEFLLHSYPFESQQQRGMEWRLYSGTSPLEGRSQSPVQIPLDTSVY